MDVHKNAKGTPASRALLVRRIRQEGWTVAAGAEAAGLSVRRAYHWLARARDEGEAGLVDRTSCPRRRPHAIPRHQLDRVLSLRRQRQPAAEIAQRLGLPVSTVGRLLRRNGLGRLSALDPKPPVVRYERATPGELLHIDVKKLARIVRPGHRVTGNRAHQPSAVGYDFVHVCVDDSTRFAYVEILADERKHTVSGFLERAAKSFAARQITVTGVMTDNGSGYVSKVFRDTCRRVQIRHCRTKPFCPRTNGKAERFIQTLLREWAYRFRYENTAQRTAMLWRYLHFYNYHRAHRSLGGLPPVSRLRLNNVVSTDS